jgi:hypothetical protein
VSTSSQAVEERRLTVTSQDVYVALQVRFPQLRSLLVSGIQCRGAEALAESFVQIAHTAAAQHLPVTGDAPVRADNDNGEGQSSSIRLHGIECALDLPRLKSFVKEESVSRMLVFSTRDFMLCPASSAIASAVDSVVLLVQAQKTTKTALTEARQRVSDLGLCLGGVVYSEGSFD